MANDDTGAAALPSVTASPSNTAAKPAGRRTFTQWLLATETGFSFVKGLTFISFAGTLIAAYFQYLSAYQDKVQTQAKDDLAAATAAFIETSNALSTPMTLQGLLAYDFGQATKLKVDTDQNALPTRNASDMYKPYDDAFSALHENINLFARKMEIYLDWPSDLGLDPAAQTGLGQDPISTSMLGAYNFDCDSDMPSFEAGKTTVHLKGQDGSGLDVDWYSAKHHVLTMGYCLDVTHKTWLEIVLQWASHSSLNPSDVAAFFAGNNNTASLLQARLDSQVVRLNAFMTLAMNEIERIRARYQPNGFVCHIPLVSEAVALVSKTCKQI
jgi:hypothetical protein